MPSRFFAMIASSDDSTSAARMRPSSSESNGDVGMLALLNRSPQEGLRPPPSYRKTASSTIPDRESPTPDPVIGGSTIGDAGLAIADRGLGIQLTGVAMNRSRR